MADLKLSFACTPYDRVQPLITGEVKPDGITLEYEGAPGGVPRIFYEQIKFQRYDVSEMSMSSYLRMRPIGLPYRLLPVFHNRNFSYTYVHLRRDADVRQGHPEDLKGKRIGIGDYQQSLGLWTRGILQMEFGVKPEDMVWYQERGEHFSHTGAAAAAGLRLPANLRLNYAKTDFNTMFARGELHAATGLGFRSGRAEVSGLSRTAVSGIDRAREAIEAPDLITLFADPKAEAIRFFKKTGVYPPNHTTVVREGILDAHPWVALSLMEAFEESKRVASERFRRNVPSLIVFGPNYLREIDEVFGPDPFPYGIKANAKAFDMAQTFSVEQGLSERKQPFEEIFPQEIIYSEERFS
jgi:4,5-dihydroxyphthalate decarboxylase